MGARQLSWCLQQPVAWVVSVMLPPAAHVSPCSRTLLEFRSSGLPTTWSLHLKSFHNAALLRPTTMCAWAFRMQCEKESRHRELPHHRLPKGG